MKFRWTHPLIRCLVLIPIYFGFTAVNSGSKPQPQNQLTEQASESQCALTSHSTTASCVSEAKSVPAEQVLNDRQHCAQMLSDK